MNSTLVSASHDIIDSGKGIEPKKVTLPEGQLDEAYRVIGEGLVGLITENRGNSIEIQIRRGGDVQTYILMDVPHEGDGEQTLKLFKLEQLY